MLAIFCRPIMLQRKVFVISSSPSSMILISASRVANDRKERDRARQCAANSPHHAQPALSHRAKSASASHSLRAANAPYLQPPISHKFSFTPGRQRIALHFLRSARCPAHPNEAKNFVPMHSSEASIVHDCITKKKCAWWC